MRLPIVAASPFLPARSALFIYLAAFAGILAVAARYRFGLSQQPFLDPDSWGYLNPGLSKLTGGPFIHTFGRDTLYPAFVYALLGIFGDFRAIGAVQHGLGLGAGVFMALAWDDLCRLLLPSHRPLPLLLRLAGLLPVTAYLNSSLSLQYEHSFRPEAVFPSFAMLSLWLNLALIRLRWWEPAPRGAALLGAGALIAAIILYKLKPAFGFGVVFAAAPALLSFVRPGISRPLKLGSFTAVVAAAIVLLVPEYRLKQTDPFSRTFLPDTLFAVHADMIADQMGDDLAHRVATPFAPELLQALHARLLVLLAESRRPENHPYPTLGFNPDYLLFIQNPFTSLLPPKHEGRFLRIAIENYFYRRTATQQPGRMFRKVILQLQQFYRFGINTKSGLLGTSVDPVSAYYGRSVAFMDTVIHSAVAQKFTGFPPGRALRADSVHLSQIPQEISPQYFSTALRDLLCWCYLPGLLATLILVIVATLGKRPMFAPALLLGFIYGYNFGNNLTIAIVHSLVADRYVANELSFTLFASAAGLLFVFKTLFAGHAAPRPEPGSSTRRPPAPD